VTSRGLAARPRLVVVVPFARLAPGVRDVPRRYVSMCFCVASHSLTGVSITPPVQRSLIFGFNENVRQRNREARARCARVRASKNRKRSTVNAEASCILFGILYDSDSHAAGRVISIDLDARNTRQSFMTCWSRRRRLRLTAGLWPSSTRVSRSRPLRDSLRPM
jgi:hypothetical protein